MKKMMNKMMNKMKKMDVPFTLMLVLLLILLYFIYVTFNLSEAFESSCGELPQKLNKDKQLVLFYADWCGHCKNIKPEWDDAAKTVGDEKMIKVNVGDGTEEQKKTMNTYGIQGFPTIIKFENGSPSGPFESRDKNSFLDFFS